MQIDADFDSGNIIVNSVTESDVVLAIRSDSNAAFYQWFYFRATGEAVRRFRIANAAGASYPKAWHGYAVLASYNEQDWFRIPTHYDGMNLIFEHTAEQQTVSYAFFVPYTEQRRAAFVTECAASPLVRHRVLGHSLQGRPLDLLTIGQTGGKKVWVITRQHAGEPNAEWTTEGLVRRLLDAQDPVTQSLLAKATLYVVPNMNPDGSSLGNLRANAAGVDLNRAWNKPSPNCPEIIAALQAFEQTGMDMLIDMHGDEERPFIWIFQPNIPLTDEIAAVQKQFEAELASHNPQLKPAPQTIGSVTSGDLGMATNYAVATYHCPSWTVELPAKAIPDGAGNEDSLLAEGCMHFGRTFVDALNAIIN
ncbi:MAG: hypothetical protein K8J31_03890 [Anaerolineae bacterium]|nr:hypothetical protein [Anaerolineae bacterium]